MGVLLYHETAENGQVALSEGRVAGDPTPARTYQQEGRFLHIDGPAHVIEHDVAEVLRLGYRLATAAEQNLFAGATRKRSSLTEKSAPSGKSAARDADESAQGDAPKG